jgi:hypothetical protein
MTHVSCRWRIADAIAVHAAVLGLALVAGAVPPLAADQVMDDTRKTFLTFNSDKGDYIGGGRTWTVTPLDGTITASVGSSFGSSYVEVVFGGSTSAELFFEVPVGQAFAPGIYEGATEWPVQSPTKPGMEVDIGTLGCSSVSGRFVVLDVFFGPGGDVQSLAIDYEQHCGVSAPALLGSVRFNSAVSVEPRISVASAAVYELDGGPGVLSLWVSLSERASTTVLVDYATVDQSAHAGINYVSVSGTLTFDVGVTAIPVDVPVLDTGVLQSDLTLVLSLARPRGASLAFAPATGTIMARAMRTFLTFNSDKGDPVGRGQTWTVTPLDGTITATAWAGSSGDSSYVAVHFEGSSTWWDLRFAMPVGQAFAPGIYEGAARWGSQSPTQPGMDVSGNGFACDEITGQFVVLDVQFGPAGDVQSLAIDYEQHCEGLWYPRLIGSVRLNSKIPANPRATLPRSERRHLGHT